ncbi:MAG: MotA/TolQ/ExbB proton channel family protein [Persicimonas sp.]
MGLGGNASADEGLKGAYQQEVSYLEAQRDALEERLVELDERERDQLGAAERELDTLQGRLLSLQTQGDRLEDTLMEVERDAERASQGEDGVATTVEQANVTFEKWGVSVDEAGDGDQIDETKTVGMLFDTSTSLLREHGSIRTEMDAFFLPDGSKQDGKIVRVGNVAAYGVSDEVAGALAPAGDGRLKLWKQDAAESARALAEGESPQRLQAFLFESLDKPVEERKEKTWREIINSGGVIAWVIVGLGGLGVLLVLLRVLILWRSGANTRGLLDEAGKFVLAGDVDAARERCEVASGSASRVLANTLANLDAGRDELEDVVSESILHELPSIERFGSAILVFAAVAPLLGLLGTVTGMISTFDIITEFGTGDPKLLSGGISEALVTTQLGLMVAIPLLLVGNLLKGWAGSITTAMERGALRLMNLARIARGFDDEAPAGDKPSGDKPRPRLEKVETPDDLDDYLGAI